MFENISLVYKDRLSIQGLEVVRTIEDFLKGSDFTSININGINKKTFLNKDLVISIGGDGTTLNTAIYLDSTPLLAINPEPKRSLGALTNFGVEDLDKVKAALNGDYKIIHRRRAQTILNGKKLEEKALNEVRIGVEMERYGAAEYEIEFNGTKEHHKCSFVAVATGSGSTAVYRSGDGKPFPYDSEFLRFKVMLPVKGELFRPKLLESGEIKKGDSIKFVSLRFFGGEVLIDGGVCYPFNNNDVCEVTLAETPLNVIVPN